MRTSLKSMLYDLPPYFRTEIDIHMLCDYVNDYVINNYSFAANLNIYTDVSVIDYEEGALYSVSFFIDGHDLFVAEYTVEGLKEPCFLDGVLDYVYDATFEYLVGKYND